MKVTIHQPEFLPWLGFFNRIKKADVFVILDDVGYQKNGFINRNRIKISDGSRWLTVPVKDRSPNKKINEVFIDNEKLWQGVQLALIKQYYHSAPYFGEYYKLLENIFQEKWEKISELDEVLIEQILISLEISTKVKISSQMHIEGQGTERLVKICQAIGADEYLSGPGGKEYIDLSLFDKAGIKIIFQEFVHPTYSQQFGDFLPGMSIIDALFNCGSEKTKKLIS